MQPKFIPITKRMKDYTGQRFGRLIALGPAKRHKASIVWLCKCDCGNFSLVHGVGLRSGQTRSCGCIKSETTALLKKSHGMHGSALYTTWRGIIQRCYDPNAINFSDYGGRGITIHDEWRHDFQAFYDYITQLPNCREKGYSIDRIDNNKNYEPNNIRFANRTKQNRNKRTNRMITYDGKTQCLAAWAEELKIHISTLSNRLRSGWSIERALTTPVATEPGSHSSRR